MDIAAWNVNGNARALQERPDLNGADILLLNEAPPSLQHDGLEMAGEEYTQALDCPQRPGPCSCKGRNWSAAIVSPHPLRPISDARISKGGRTLAFGPSRRGSWVARRVAVEPDVEVTAISLYGLMGGEKSDESVHRSLSELSPIFDHKDYGRFLVLGGDLNTLAKPSRGEKRFARDKSVLDRIEALGLEDLLKRDIRLKKRSAEEGCDCGSGDGCEHTWTYKQGGNLDTVYQDDYLFASPDLAALLPDCRPLGFTDASDHAPILASTREE